MKTKQQILDSDSVFLNDWECVKDVFHDFKHERGNAKILFASYRYEDYSGSAFVLFSEDGELYQVHGSHCSCFGLEDQWSPEKVNLEALEKSVEASSYTFNHCQTELRKFLGMDEKKESEKYE